MTPARLVATWFGVGRAPWAPGTFGTLAAVPVVAALWWAGPWWSVLAAGGIVAAVGTVCAGIVQREGGVADPPEIVIDEVAGYLLACSLGPPGWLTAVAAFVMFRTLDILKPWPFSALERLPGGAGVMADDVAAGLATAFAIRLVWALPGVPPP